MQSTITTHTKRYTSKPFSWSWSRVTAFETCPKRYYHYSVAQDVKEEESEAITYGNTVHKVLAERLEGKPLPKPFEHLEEWAIRIGTGGDLLVEQKMAITKDFEPCEWRSRDAWFRGIADVVKIVGQVALVVDWKTGKLKDESQQLALMAQCVFAHHPHVRKIRSEFVWLKEQATTRADFAREDMAGIWLNLLPRVASLEQAHSTETFPAKPGFLCRKWCSVTKCPHHGE